MSPLERVCSDHTPNRLYFPHWSENRPKYQSSSREKRNNLSDGQYWNTKFLTQRHEKVRGMSIRQCSWDTHYRNVSCIRKWHTALFPPWIPVYIATSTCDGANSDLKKIKLTRRDAQFPIKSTLMKTCNCVMNNKVHTHSKIKTLKLKSQELLWLPWEVMVQDTWEEGVGREECGPHPVNHHHPAASGCWE